MAKFIEVHKKPLGIGGNAYLILQNLDDVSQVYPTESGGAGIMLRSVSTGMGIRRYEVTETYDQLRLMIGAAQGGIPMDVDKGGCY